MGGHLPLAFLRPAFVEHIPIKRCCFRVFAGIEVRPLSGPVLLAGVPICDFEACRFIPANQR